MVLSFLTDPSTCCFLTSVRDHPIQLWDLSTRTVRASYSAIDHCERFIGPNVISFNLDGSKYVIFINWKNTTTHFFFASIEFIVDMKI